VTFDEILDGIGHGPGPDPAISIRQMSFRYPNGVQALDRVNLHVSRGATLGIIGPNGGGKTTLLKILLGLLTGYTGEVEVFGMPPQRARARGDIVSWVPQQSALNIGFPVSVREVVEMGLAGKRGIFGKPAREDIAYIDRLLDTLDIAHLADRPIGALSGGQRQRVLIARALVSSPRLLMLDEPATGVDATGRRLLRELLAEVKRSFEVTLVIVSHDLGLLLAFTRRVACLNRVLHFHDAPEMPEAEAERYACDLDGILPAACSHEAAGEGGSAHTDPD